MHSTSSKHSGMAVVILLGMGIGPEKGPENPKIQICPKCGGTGKIDGNTCGTCGGSGRIKANQ